MMACGEQGHGGLEVWGFTEEQCGYGKEEGAVQL